MKTLKRTASGGFAAVVGAVGMLLCFAGVSMGQLPDKYIPVVFYDFHSDRSNPEFEQPHDGGHRPGMVQLTLDEDGKPQAVARKAGEISYLEQGIRFWFRDNSKLSSYKMAGKPDPDATGHNYLDRFRPIYTYGDKVPPNVLNPDAPNGEWKAAVTYRRRAYVDKDFNFTDNYGPVNITQNNSIDTAYKNKRIPAWLRFKHQAGTNGTYEFIKTGKADAGFFPLTERGGALYDANYDGGTDRGGVEFCHDADSCAGGRPTKLPGTMWGSTGTKNYNLSFTMEMPFEFIYRNGDNLMFEFMGDDDVWLFINGRLVNEIDIGGIHEAVTKSVYLSQGTNPSKYNLEEGKKATFNFFYAERHSDDSNIKITTNIVNAVDVGMEIRVTGDTIVAGVPKPAWAVIEMETGEYRKDFAKGSFTWKATDVGPQKNGTPVAGQQVTVAPGNKNAKPLDKSDSITVTATKAYTWVKILGSYYDSLTNHTVKDSIYVWVAPGPATQVSIEGSDNQNVSLNNVNKLDTIRILSTAEADSNFYAILRDKYGNWVGVAATGPTAPVGRSITWTTATPSVATAAVNDAGRGRGKATRAANSGITPITVTYTMSGTTLTGSSVVKLDNVTYKGIQLGVKQGGSNGTFVPLSSNSGQTGTIRMTVGTDTTLWVQAQRSDNNKWEEVPASWVVTDLRTDPGAPTGTSVSWNMKPVVPTTNGVVTVTLSGVSAKLNVIVEVKDPAAARFFTKSGNTPVFDPPVTVYQDAANSGSARMYAVPTTEVQLVAGTRMPLVGMLFSSTSVSAETKLDKTTTGVWTWAPVPGSPSITCADCGITTVNPTVGGDSATFRSTVALYGNDPYKIRATYKDPARNITLTHDIWIRVIPDVANPVLVIEPNPDGKTLSPNAPQKVGELVFTDGDVDNGVQKKVYAVIRDKYGNYICASGDDNPYPPPVGAGNTAWSEIGKSIVTLEPGYKKWGEEFIAGKGETSKGQETKVVAYDNLWARSDTIKISFRGYDYSGIEIVTKCKSGQSPWFTVGGVAYCDVNDPLIMTSNDDEQIYVFGKRNDCDVTPGITGNACWESIPGNWSRDSDLAKALGTPPSGTPTWILSPTTTGEGQIIVSRPGTDQKDTINVKITVGPPLRAELVILTPADQLIAGKEISAQINYYNRAGLMTEWNPAWSSTNASLFADTLGLGPTTQKPLVKSVKGTDELCYQGGVCQSANAVLAHNPTNLNDVVSFIIYYAADGHQIRYNETLTVGQITALSPPFTVKAGEPSRLEIEDNTGNKIDTLKVNQGDPEQVLHSVAYDDYGNKIGDYPSDWFSQTPIPYDAKDRPILVYVPGQATDNGTGQLCISVPGKNQLKDCITVIVTGVTVRPLSTITRDYDGCGYLDRIEMKFKKPITFAGGNDKAKGRSDVGDAITVIYEPKNFTWAIDSVTVNPKDSTVTIWLEDKTPHTGATQTGWLPIVKINTSTFFDEAGKQDVMNVTDGAPPVIATAKLYFPKESNGKNISENYIDVAFSEKVMSSDKTAFGGGNKNGADTKYVPEVLFNMWRQGQNKAKMARTRALSKTTGDAYDGKPFVLRYDDNPLVGITKSVYIDESTVRFYLESEKPIEPPNDYINIRTKDQEVNPWDPTAVLDMPGNIPLANNRKVPITFGNEPNENLKAIPNPASPESRPRQVSGGYTVRPGVIVAVHDREALELIRNPSGPLIGGTVFEVPVYVPTTGTVKCQLKVYDLAGNLVVAGESNNAASGMETGYSKMHLYWNGYNSKKMKVAPGTYRMVVYISYSNLGKNDENAKNKKYQGLVGMSK